MILRVPAMHCAGCARTVREGLSKIGGVREVTVDLGTKSVRIALDRRDGVMERIYHELEALEFPGGEGSGPTP